MSGKITSKYYTIKTSQEVCLCIVKVSCLLINFMPTTEFLFIVFICGEKTVTEGITGNFRNLSNHLL